MTIFIQNLSNDLFESFTHNIMRANCLFRPLDRRSLLYKQPFITVHFKSSLRILCITSGGSGGLIQPWPPSSLTVEFAPFNEEIAVETEDYTNLGLLSRMFTLHAPLISREAPERVAREKFNKQK